ncbi:amidohydrolase family protein [Paenibacillus hodogayensis]|uniref:Amidohydrolase family protein n=1 Tax=Paenibacillus hodogayensis TaxID=279208 RepID=A0ABV5VX72_9BACL
MTASKESNGMGKQAENREHGASGHTLSAATRLLEPFAAEKAIDLTAFMGQWPARLSVRASADDLSAMADRLGLGALCVSHIASIFGFDTREGNEELFRETAGDSRLWPFAIVNPDEAGWEQELEWAAGAGARGIRIVPGYHRYSLASPQALDLVKRLESYRLPLHICLRLEDERLVHPRLPVSQIPPHEVAELLRQAGSLPIVLSGLRAHEWAGIAEHLNDDERAQREKLVLLDLWFANGPIGVIASLCLNGSSSRLGYGSCAPIQVPEATALQLAAADITPEHRTALCRGNASTLLGL